MTELENNNAIRYCTSFSPLLASVSPSTREFQWSSSSLLIQFNAEWERLLQRALLHLHIGVGCFCFQDIHGMMNVGRVCDASDTCEYVQYFVEIDVKLRDLEQLMQYSAWFSIN